jgi:SagB-type dehydrogenase family enzyme
MTKKIQSVLDYHERTKHHPHRYAASPGFLDWANEPDPFRRYEGARLLSLALGKKDPDAEYQVFTKERQPLSAFLLENISKFLELSLGLSAWKSYEGTTWALRMNPSSGNLHPTEAYVVLGPLPENNNLGGIYHYSPYLHALEQRAEFDDEIRLKIVEHFGTEGFFICLSSIYWRESWKYGERAFRYCNQDIGHAMAALSLGNLPAGRSLSGCLRMKTFGPSLGFRKRIGYNLKKSMPRPCSSFTGI